MSIIDAQVHVWGRDTVDRPWPANGAERAIAHTDRGIHLRGRHHEFGADEVLAAMDAVGVDAAVLVPPNFEGDRNDVALAAARSHPDRFAVMGRVSLQSPGPALERMSQWRSNPGALGFRVSFTRGTPAERWLTDGTADWFWQAAQEHGLPLMVNVHGQLDALADVARRYPDLRIVLDHFGLHGSDLDERALAGVRMLKPLAELANIAVKATAAPSYTTAGYPFPVMQACIAELVGTFGADRVFWGSDLSRLPCPYRQALDLVARECDFLTPEERRLVLGDALAGWLRWDPGRA